MEKLLLIDGLSILNRAFYALPLMTTKEGIYTNAVYGFIKTMLSLIETEKPDFLGVAFDVNRNTFRTNIASYYKETRKDSPAEFKSQIKLLKDVLDIMNIYRIEKEGFEADDLIGTISKKITSENIQIVITSGDKDLLQLATDRVQIQIPKTKNKATIIETYFEQDVINTYGVTPTEFIDVKGLMGDPSDNIKGVPSVGEKTATKLISEYKSIEELYENIDNMKKSKLKESLILYKDQAIESKLLATIDCNVDIKVDIENFKYDLAPTKQIEQLFTRLQFNSLLDKFSVKHLDPAKIYEIVHPMELSQMLIDQYECEISYEILYNLFELKVSIQNQNFAITFNLDNELDKMELSKFLINDDYMKIVYDSKKMRHELKAIDLKLGENVFDEFLAEYLTGEQENLRQTLEDFHMSKLFYDVEQPLAKVLFDMEVEGIKINLSELKQYGQKIMKFIEEEEKQVYEMVGEKFNINSPKQLGEVLFEKMNIPPVKKNKTGYSTSVDILEKLKPSYPVVERILKYRQYAKLNNTYVIGLEKVLTKDHKIHSTFTQTVTTTGRLSSTEPNLQNIPIRTELGHEIRKFFIPRSEDYIFLDADYSQIELRVLAGLSKDETLINAFKNNQDIHTLTASQVFNIPIEEVTPEHRYKAKAVNFGIVYGIGAFSLSEDIHVSVQEAQQYIDNYFKTYPKVKIYLDNLIQSATEKGYSTTVLNRRREILELRSPNFTTREFGKRIAMNTPIQGTSADIIKIAMIRVHKKFKENNFKSKLILTVHDELLIDTFIPEKDKVKEILKYEMENALDIGVELKVEIKEGKNWYDAK
ncbi:hypothetical protein AN639_10370 [Candidatus Epulonipiscium fishelsonii]|uniref:Uncharacterized protein n=1 Tax=Candidatus Epulonipiscium fishelsonii TaxID=77094 RepID=A0ACC8XAD1_9FIRM|nr:hypothetical protein AN396_08990 [Epulopiscium sp. SCG-B11WGA-EpuloA1]ONI43499.1 hypothetical protein AN639_10370 [Epulopiscium sp. SCG-B05WGA-EpuloA1]